MSPSNTIIADASNNRAFTVVQDFGNRGQTPSPQASMRCPLRPTTSAFTEKVVNFTFNCFAQQYPLRLSPVLNENRIWTAIGARMFRLW